MLNHLMRDTQMPTCQYNDTCENRTDTCQENTMTEELHAKPIIPNKFWIVEKGGEKFATLRMNDDNRFVMSNEAGIKIFDNKESITRQYGKDFFVKIVKEADNAEPNEVHGYATSTSPHNAMFDVQRKLPLFTKSSDSKSLYCAGYYVIQFEKGWVKSFCPKLITLQRYQYQGPFKTEFEMKRVLSNVNK